MALFFRSNAAVTSGYGRYIDNKTSDPVSGSIRAVVLIKMVESAFEATARSDPAQLQRSGLHRRCHRRLAKGQRGKTPFITPAAPKEHAHIESFHDKLRDEQLNRELFGSLLEAKILVGGGDRNTTKSAGTPRRITKTPQEYAAPSHPPSDPKPKPLNSCYDGSPVWVRSQSFSFRRGSISRALPHYFGNVGFAPEWNLILDICTKSKAERWTGNFRLNACN